MGGEEVPIGQQLLKIHKFLQEKLESFSSEEILRETGVDIDGSQQILDSLTGDASKVLREKNGKWRWASKYQLTSSHELRSLLARSLNGVSEKDLYDSYKSVKDDIKALKKRNAVIEIKSGSKVYLFPRDPRLEIEVSEELKQRYKEVSIPDEREVEAYLVQHNLKKTDPEASSAQPITRKRPGRRKDGKKRQKKMKLTNTHMLGSNIDLTKDYDTGKESAFK